jgi:hypothetical protein
MLLDLDEQTPVGHCVRGSGDPAVETLERHRTRAARQLHAIDDLGDRAHGCELLLVPGHEQHALLIADVYSERQRHAREDDRVFHWD